MVTESEKVDEIRMSTFKKMFQLGGRDRRLEANLN